MDNHDWIDALRWLDTSTASNLSIHNQASPSYQDEDGAGYDPSIFTADNWTNPAPVASFSEQALHTSAASGFWPLHMRVPDPIPSNAAFAQAPMYEPSLSTPATKPINFSSMVSFNSTEPLPYLTQGFANSHYEKPAMVWTGTPRIDAYDAAPRPHFAPSQTLQHTSIGDVAPSISTNPSSSAATPPSFVCSVQSTNNPQTFVFQCTFPRCRARTFTRWYDFLRHYNGAHAAEKTVFWCSVRGCSRSEGEGNNGFPRKDKMLSHVEKMHGRAG